MPLKPGSVLWHRYRIESVLGQGGMGAVCRAIDINLGVAVAVKENLFTTDEFARQFKREATILASLRHPNLPRVTDHFVIPGEGQYLVMDFVAGEDLRQRLERSGPVPENEGLPWFLEICDALAYLHTRVPPILHRDIKPGNIKLTPDGKAMLVDFGLAKVVEDAGNTTTGAKAMTPGFSPPEQYGSGRTDPRTDIYSLGATMYASFTARIPEDALERAMGREHLTPLRERNPEISSGLARAIEKALEVRPDERYQTVVAFAAALRAAATASRPTVVRHYPYLERTAVRSAETVVAPSKPRTARPAARRRFPWLAAGMAGAALVAGVALLPVIGGGLAGIFARGNSTASPAPSRTPQPFEPTASLQIPVGFTVVPSFPPSTPVDGPTAAPTPGATPVGGGQGQLAFASTRSGVAQIYLVNFDGTDIVQLTDLDDGACQPAWSPDGNRLAFTSPCRVNSEFYEGSQLFLMNADGTGLEPLPYVPGGDFDPAWSADGRRIAFASMRDLHAQIYVIELETRQVTKISRSAGAESQPVWSPSGAEILYVSRRGGPGELWIMPESGGGTKFSRSGAREDTHPDWSHDGSLILFEQEQDSFSRLMVTRFADRGIPENRVCPHGDLATIPMAEGRLSPDGGWIAFETWPTGSNHEIAVMSSACTNYKELTTDPALDFDPAWRP
ncbi:MAG TPA: protein kinase [Anaerolineales bacterium]|nr:protein kinase [Anaerolineales bacterium]